MIFDFSREVKTLTSERERKEAMIDHIVRPEVEKVIREAGLNPSYFILNKASEQEFFNRPFSDTHRKMVHLPVCIMTGSPRIRCIAVNAGLNYPGIF